MKDPSFVIRRMVGEGKPLLREILGHTGPRWSENADFALIFARSASAVTSCEKVQLTLTGSPLRAFQ